MKSVEQNKAKRLARKVLMAGLLIVLHPSFANAACTSPAGSAGAIVYSSTTNLMAYCNGASWISMGQSSAVSFSGLTAGALCSATSSTAISCSSTGVNLATQVSGILPPANGGTGVANTGTITLGGNLTTSGAYTLTLTTTGNTSVTLPTSGTLIAGPASAAQGDILYYNGSAWTNLGAGTSGYVLQTQGAGANPTWAALSVGTASITGTVGVGQGGTGTATAFTQGSVVFAGASGIYSQDNANFFYDTTNHRLGIGTASPTANLTINGTTVFAYGVDYTTVGTQSAVALGAASAARYTGTASATFNGIAAGANGQVLNLTNASTYTLTLPNQSTSETTAANRIVTGNSADVVLQAGASALLQYDGTTSRWRVLASGASTPAGTTTQLQFNTAGAFNADSNLTWDNTNKYLGVGTTTPAYNIDAATGTVAGTIMQVNPQAVNPTVATSSGPVAINTATINQMAYFAGTNTISGTSSAYVGTNGIGIGTETPGVIFDVVTQTAGDGERFTAYGSGSSGAASLTLRSSRGTAASPVALQSGDRIGGIFFNGYDGSAFSIGVGAIFGEVDGTVTGGTALPSRLTFWTTPSGSETRAERMRIDSAGNVGIGTTSPGYPLHVKGSVTGEVRVEGPSYAKLSYNASGAGTDQKRWQTYAYIGGMTYSALNDAENAEIPYMSVIRGTGTAITYVNFPNGSVGIGTTAPAYKLQVAGVVAGAGAYVNTSDVRLKTDIVPLTYGLDTVMHLRPVAFNWKKQDQEWQKQHQVGLIAQEVESLVPEVVSTASDEAKTKSLAYGSLVPVVIKAVQDLKFLFDGDHADLAKLRADKDELRALVIKQGQELKAQNDALRAEFEKYKGEHR